MSDLCDLICDLNKQPHAQDHVMYFPTSPLDPAQVLQLGSNQVASISSLQLSSLTSLRTLFLNNNDITRIDGLEGLVSLQVGEVKGVGVTGKYSVEGGVCGRGVFSSQDRGQAEARRLGA